MTGICVTYNTADLFKRAFESIKKHHPHINFIIVDGSESNNACHVYTESIRKHANIMHLNRNIGHGRGLDLGLRNCNDDIAFVFDSDIVMLRSPLAEMASMMTPETYGVGWITTIGHDGFDFGTPNRGHIEPIPYLHPYFAMINVELYKQFAPFVHHGAPWYKAAIDLFERGFSNKMLRSCPLLTGHSTGYGINWRGQTPTHIRHDFGGTREMNRRHGKREIHGQWEK